MQTRLFIDGKKRASESRMPKDVPSGLANSRETQQITRLVNDQPWGWTLKG